MHKLWLRQLENEYMIKQAGETNTPHVEDQNDRHEQQSLFNESVTSVARSCRSLASIPYVDTQRERKQLKRVLRKAQRIDPRSHGIGSPGGHIARVYTPAASRRTSNSTTPYKYGLAADELLSFGKFNMSGLPPWNSYFMKSRPKSPKEQRMELLDYEEKTPAPSFASYIDNTVALETEPLSSRSRDRNPRRTTRRPSATARLTPEEMNVWAKQLHILAKQADDVAVSDLVELSSLPRPPASITDRIVYLSLCIGGSGEWPDARMIVFQDINLLVAFIKSADPTVLRMEHIKRAVHFLNSRPPCSKTEKINKAAVAFVKWIQTFHTLCSLLMLCDGRLPAIADNNGASEQINISSSGATVPRRGGISLFAETYQRQESTGHSLLGRMHSVMLSIDDDDDDSTAPALQVAHSSTLGELLDRPLIVEPPPDVVVDVTNAYMFYECDIRGRPLLDSNGNFIPLKRKDLARYKDMLRAGESAESTTTTAGSQSLTASDVMFGNDLRTQELSEIEKDEELRQEAIRKNKDFVEAVVKAQMLENGNRTSSSKHNSLLS